MLGFRTLCELRKTYENAGIKNESDFKERLLQEIGYDRIQLVTINSAISIVLPHFFFSKLHDRQSESQTRHQYRTGQEREQ